MEQRPCMPRAPAGRHQRSSQRCYNAHCGCSARCSVERDPLWTRIGLSLSRPLVQLPPADRRSQQPAMFAVALPTTGVTLQTRREVTTAATKPREHRGALHRGLCAGLSSQQQHALSVDTRPGRPSGAGWRPGGVAAWRHCLPAAVGRVPGASATSSAVPDLPPPASPCLVDTQSSRAPRR